MTKTYDTWNLPAIEVKEDGVLQGKYLSIIDIIGDSNGNYKRLGVYVRDTGYINDTHSTYTALTDVINRFISKGWTITITSSNKSIYRVSEKSKSFLDTVRIVPGDEHRSLSSKAELSEGILTFKIKNDRSEVTWRANVDVKSITGITAECIPLKVRDSDSPVLGRAQLTPIEGKGAFEVCIDVMDTRLLDGITQYEGTSYGRKPIPTLTMPGYTSTDPGGHRGFIHVVNGVYGLALAMHVTGSTGNHSFPETLKKMFYHGENTTYIFNRGNGSIDLTSVGFIQDAVSQLESQTETIVTEPVKKD